MKALHRLRPYLPPLLILLIGAGLFWVLVATRPEPPAKEEGEPAWVVDVRTVSPGPRAPTLSLYGRLESPRASTRTAAVEGDVEAVPAREGRVVAEEDLLVRLDSGDIEDDLAQRRADLAEIEATIDEARAQHRADRDSLEQQEALVELAGRAVDRAKQLAGRDMGSRAELDAAREARRQARLELIRQRLQVESFDARLEGLEAQRQRAAAQVAQAERDLERTRVEAPFRGRVTAVEVAPGDRVRPGDPLVGLYDSDALEVRATIPASQAEGVVRALEAERTVTAVVRVDGRELEAELDRLGGRSPENSGGVEALFRIRGEAPSDLALDRFAEVTVEMPERPGLVAVPYSALYDHDRLFVVREGRLVRLEVERAGQRAVADGPSLALVRSPDLRDGDRVVTTQLPRARDGLKVRVREDGAETP